MAQGDAEWRRRLSAAVVPLAVLAIGLAAYKLHLLQRFGLQLFDCRGCLAGHALIHELQLLLLLATLHGLSLLFTSAWLRRGLRVLVITILLLAALDHLVLTQFVTRFTLYELIRFSGEPHTVLTFIQLHLLTWRALTLSLIMTTAFVLLFARYLLEAPPSTRAHWPGVLILLSGTLATSVVSHVQPPQFHARYQQHSLSAFLAPQSRTRPYTAAFAASVPPAPPPLPERCHAGQGMRPNVILVVFESLSLYHSHAFSGIHDWTPNLDRLAGQGLTLERFIANGTSTEDGLLALLTGEPPVSPPGTLGAFEQTRPGMQTVARTLAHMGYRTAFLTTGDLAFSDKGEWLDLIGFQVREGHTAPFYDGMPRGHFQAASDGALYDRALQWMSETSEDQPFFLTLETVTTHHPFIDPDTGRMSEERAFRYADRALGRFADALGAQGFFDQGVLLITSDHRAMVPIRRQEYLLLGERAYSRIPFVAVGAGLPPQRSWETFSQTDLLPSLRYWLGREPVCLDANQGIFLPAPRQMPTCLYTRRSYDPNSLFVECGEVIRTLRLDADTTGDGARQDAPEQALIDQVNRLRLGRGWGKDAPPD